MGSARHLQGDLFCQASPSLSANLGRGLRNVLQFRLPPSARPLFRLRRTLATAYRGVLGLFHREPLLPEYARKRRQQCACSLQRCICRPCGAGTKGWEHGRGEPCYEAWLAGLTLKLSFSSSQRQGRVERRERGGQRETRGRERKSGEEAAAASGILGRGFRYTKRALRTTVIPREKGVFWTGGVWRSTQISWRSKCAKVDLGST